MYLEKLHLENLRNLNTPSLAFSPGFNYLHGANGAGKSAVLEAIHLLARGRSFRTQKIASIIRHGEHQLIVRGEVTPDIGVRRTLAMSKTRSGHTELKLDAERQSRASVLARHLPVQMLLPEAPGLVLDGPGERRAFLDWGLFHVEPQFLGASRRYRRVLMQRNTWLKTLRMTNADSDIREDPWHAQLMSLGLEINGIRAHYVDALSDCFVSTLARLGPDLDVHLEYHWGGLVSAQETEKKLGESWSRDVKFGMTHRGPHRADLLFTVAGRQAADAVSRGQAKLIASAAILAQAELLHKRSGTKSLFLIDDFGAELDAVHWQLFLHTLLDLECQVIATSTEPIDLSQDWVRNLAGLQVFHVEQGKIS